jgi:uncharacterized protein with PIN domain
MTFFFDNNLSHKIVKGLREFGEDVVHLADEFPRDTTDEEWLPIVGERGWILITRDKKIRRRPAEIDAYRRNGIGGFVLTGKSLEGWKIIRQLVNRWEKIKELARSTRKPFLFRIPPRGSKIERLPL